MHFIYVNYKLLDIHMDTTQQPTLLPDGMTRIISPQLRVLLILFVISLLMFGISIGVIESIDKAEKAANVNIRSANTVVIQENSVQAAGVGR
jgi:hypothetical protein